MIPAKAITGTPWYSITANRSYTEEFAYYGAHVAEREKLIEDGFPDKYDE